MKTPAFFIFFLVCIGAYAQIPPPVIPPAIQWQRCYGGSGLESQPSLIATADGGYIMSGFSFSTNGDLTGNYGLEDVWIVKLDAARNIQWQKNYGGSSIDQAYDIAQTPDGGYVFAGMTVSNDGDVSGNHGFQDLWVVRLDAAGAIQWQRCYGGSNNELAWTITVTQDGGYMIGGQTKSTDGDVIGNQGLYDVWLLKLDASGGIQWQKSFGGTDEDTGTNIFQTADGGYFFTAGSFSNNGDVTCNSVSFGVRWLVKLDNAGNLQWQNCLDAGFDKALQTPDGGYLVYGSIYTNRLPGYHGNGDLYVVKLSGTGLIEWEKLYGGSETDNAHDALATSDGGYIVAGYSKSGDGDLCNNRGGEDIWILKLTSTGDLEWQKTYGGSNREFYPNILLQSDGSYLVLSQSLSNDGDIIGNHGNFDLWLFVLDFPGIPVLPEVSITADKTTICPTQSVSFFATSVYGGDAPFYQWQVNGVNAGSNNDTITLNALNEGDVVRCILTSNSRCVTEPTDTSNSIMIQVDPSLNPTGFLFSDTAICNYGSIDLKPNGVYADYLWNTGATTAVIKISQPGEYWLQVLTDSGCPGKDTVLVELKECLKGFYIPTAFTPNNDGKNDLLKPVLGGNLLKYQFTIINKWGQVVFHTTDPGKGWDGKYNGVRQQSDVYVWICHYSFSGESPRFEKGTLVLIR